MINGRIKIKLNLKTVAEELADSVGSKDTLFYDNFEKTYYINNVTEDDLISNGFKFFEEAFNHAPIYKKEDVYASVQSDPAFGRTMVYKLYNDELHYREEE